jgi:hypothetical protein
LRIQLYRLLVVHRRLFRNTQTKIRITQVLVKIVLSPVSQTLLQDHYALRIPAQQVQSCSFVVMQVESQLELLRSVLDTHQNCLADLQTLLCPARLEVQVGKILGC